MKKTVGITCAGSGIGQSIVDALRLCGESYRIAGFDMNPLAYGGLYCDAFHVTPSSRDPDYIPGLIDLCRKEKIRILIPGLDDELIQLSQASELFAKHNIKVLVSPENVVRLCLDKKKLSEELFSLFPEFVFSYTRKEAVKALDEEVINFPLVGKPVFGSGSRDIRIIRNFEELKNISSEYIIQPYVSANKNDPDWPLLFRGIKKGRINQAAEISVQYLISQKGKILGRMATRNKLKAGVPIEIIPIDESSIWDAAGKIINYFMERGARGPVNLQGRLNTRGFYIFEINPRFTGISGLRAKMGFNEVKASVEDCLGKPESETKKALKYNPSQAGARQIRDAKFSVRSRPAAEEYVQKRQLGIKTCRRKTLLVTGATGYLGRNLVNTLIRDSEISRIIAAGRDERKIRSFFDSESKDKLEILILENNPVRDWNLGWVDAIIHLGHARPPHGNGQAAKSLEFTQALVSQASAYQVPEFIYISSQSVYGKKSGSGLWKEKTPLSPLTPYGTAKLAGELMVKNLKELNPQVQVWILRLPRLYGYGKGLRWQEMPHKFISDFQEKREITVHGGRQAFDLLHISDAVSAISQVLNSDSSPNHMVYNLSGGEPVTLKKLAETVNRAAEKLEIKKVPVRIIPGDDERKFGMDSTRFRKEYNWNPEIPIQEGIYKLLQNYPYHPANGESGVGP